MIIYLYISMYCSRFFVVGSLICWRNFTPQYFPLLQSKDTLHISYLKIRSNKFDLQLAGALIVDRPLRIVAVDDQHVPLQGIVEMAGKQNGEGRFSDAAFLIAYGNAYRCVFHNLLLQEEAI